ncbi:hypothetical protein [Coleofasciculus sp. FACHB-1120]|uniref:hypothetical protein n=1 Tax=Coleofasciculus sp. FACHB-1120 TaxID=2692783 RepID=UPI001681CAEA|nr:hypothetical protein [Coleofasciculus sp. FACHB-1120]MBD2744610.1 hypothetical protein [Coleofasciculus sp. FACHB-1120]
MRLSNDLWQGYSGYWQNRFIHQNILLLGYTAWMGYKNEGRGMVVCDVVDAIPPTIDWSLDTVTFDRAFIPEAQVAEYLHKYLHALKQSPEAVTPLLRAIATYDPTQAIVVLVIGNGAININLLQNLAISPSDCYEQVQRRWAEFQPQGTQLSHEKVQEN